jgi:AcrR family transcriptional regulator
MSTDARERVDRHGEERARAAVLEMTWVVLGEVGYQRLRVEAVAARAGVPRGWLRRWWTTRPLLVAEALERRDGPPAPVPTGDARTDVRAVVARMAAFLADPVVTDALAGLTADAARDPVAAERLTALLAVRRAADLSVLLSATARGDLRRDTDAPLVLDLVFGTLLVRFGRGAPPTPDTVETLVELLLRGLGDAVRPAAGEDPQQDGRLLDGYTFDGLPRDGHPLDESPPHGLALDGRRPDDGQPPDDRQRRGGEQPGDGYVLDRLPPAGHPLPRVPAGGPQNGEHPGPALPRHQAGQQDAQHARPEVGGPDGDGPVPAWSQLPERHRYP